MEGIYIGRQGTILSLTVIVPVGSCHNENLMYSDMSPYFKDNQSSPNMWTYGITYNVPTKYKYNKINIFQSASKAEDVFYVSGLETCTPAWIFIVFTCTGTIVCTKEIKEEAKAEAARREGKMRKEELIDLLGPEVERMDYLRTTEAELRIDLDRPLTNKRLKSSVQYEDHPAGTVLNEPVQQGFSPNPNSCMAADRMIIMKQQFMVPAGSSCWSSDALGSWILLMLMAWLLLLDLVWCS
ncbi:hypothetical protein Tco_0930310 [Tanacetum coccineum]